METPVEYTLDHLFRHEYGKVVSILTNRYGRDKVDEIEDAVQDALYKAMRLWPYKEIPNNPSAWLYRVANNRLIDILRRANKIAGDTIPDTVEMQEEVNLHSLFDDQLRMIFACCHPALSPTDQIMLSLKLLCGFSTAEIGRALLKQPETAKKAITRAKEKFKKEIGKLAIPEDASELANRRDAVLTVIYLLFNEGYKTTDGETLIRKDICEESIRLAGLLHHHQHTDAPEVRALLALMLLKTARFDARQDREGNLILLKDQSRLLWDQEAIDAGLRFLEMASEGDMITPYHLEAAIESHYCQERDFSKIKWNEILNLYNLLIRFRPTSVIAMNRCVVLEKVEGPEAALDALEAIPEQKLESHYLYYAIKARLLKRTGQEQEALAALDKAILLVKNKSEKKLLEQRKHRWFIAD